MKNSGPSLGGLRPWILATVVLPFTVVTLSFAVAAVEIHSRAMRDIVAERDERSVRAAAVAVSEELSNRLLAVQDIALGLAQGRGAGGALAAAGRLASDFPEGLAVVDGGGRVVAGRLPADVSGSPVLRGALAAGTGLGLIRALKEEKDTTLLAVYPGSQFGVVGAFSMTALMKTVLPGLEEPSTPASADVVDPSSGLLVHIGAPLPERNLMKNPGIRAALAGQTGSIFLTRAGGKERVLAFGPIQPVGWALLMEEPWGRVTNPLLRFSLAAPLTLVPLVLISLAVLWLALRTIVIPLRELRGQALRLSTGDFKAMEQRIHGVQEIRDLQRTMARMARRIESSQQTLRRYLGKVTSAQEEERRRLAQDLHDETIQDLIALDQKIQLAAREPQGGGKRRADSLQAIHREASEAIRRVRRLLFELRPGYLEDLGLIPALKALANDVAARAGVPTTFQAEGPEPALSPEVDLAIYRIAQESLANVVRHARSRRAWILLRLGGGELWMSVRDNGVGFAPPHETSELARAGHFGLIGMRERAQSIGARLDVRSMRGKGTKITLRVPLP